MCDMTHSYVWHDSFICVTWLIHMCDMTQSYVWTDLSICVTWLIQTCGMTYLYVWHVWYHWLICVTWLNLRFDMTHPYAGLNASCDMASLVNMCDVTSPNVWHDVFTCVARLIRMCDMCDMGWLRSVGSIKLKVSFVEYRLFYRSLLQKRPIILSILITVATPYDLRICMTWLNLKFDMKHRYAMGWLWFLGSIKL